MTDKPLTIKCPGCKAELNWTSENIHRPFCSEQCKNKDFIAWSQEELRISGNSVYDDLLSGDLPPDD